MGASRIRDSGLWQNGVRAPLELMALRDEGAEAAWDEIAETLAGAGWEVAEKRRRETASSAP